MAIAKKKKKFFDVEIPLIRRTTQLQALNIQELDGKFIKYDLTRMMKGKNILLGAEVKVNDDTATTIPKSIKILRNSIKNPIRKGTDYIEDSFVIECNNAKVTIKPILVSRRRISKRVKRALREKAKKEIISYVQDKNAEDIIAELLKNQLQKPLSLKLKKIYPLSLCEIRIFKIEERFEPKKITTQRSEEPKDEKIIEKEVEKTQEKKVKERKETKE